MIGDFLRYWRDLISWNARKSAFVRRGRRGAAPCQHPSDSGRAGETACVACIGWAKPERFRRVCPLLVRNAGEWRCSVGAAEVRPFWLRAMLAWAGAAVVGWVALTLLAFSVIQAIGYREFHYGDLWRPHVRARFREAQGEYYGQRAQEALARGDFSDGILALSISFERNPRNWSAGLLLGQLLARTRQYAASDRVFAALLASFPERDEEFANVWCDALLIRGDAAAVLDLALPRCRPTNPANAAWLRVAVAAARGGKNDSELRQFHQMLTERLPAVWREVATIEVLTGEKRSAEAVRLLNAMAPAASAGLALYRCETLLELKASDAAATQCELNADSLGRFHAGLLRTRIASARGQVALAELTFENLANGEMSPVKFGLLCAEVVRSRSAGEARMLQTVWRRHPAGMARADLVAALQVATLVSGAEWSANLDVSAGPIPRVLLAPEWRGAGKRGGELRAVLHAVPLPRDVLLALWE